MSEKFKIEYQIEDGYVGTMRLQSTTIYADAIEDDMDADAINDAACDAAYSAAIEKIGIGLLNKAELQKWAATVLAKRKIEGEQ